MELLRKKRKFPVYLLIIFDTMMNTTFNFSRFLKVLSNEWRLNLKKRLLFWGGMISITILYFVALRIGDKDFVPKNTTFILLFFVMCIMQGFYLQTYFREFSSKTKTQALLLLPASRTETFWAKFIPGVLLYVLLFSAYLFIVIKGNGIYNDWLKELYDFPATDWRYQHFEGYQTLIVSKPILFLIWLFSASAYLFGILLFKKFAVLKSLIFWFGIVMGLILLTYVVYALFTGVWPHIAIPGLLIFDKKDNTGCVIVQMYPELLYGLGLFICLALICISRIKYNEKTI